MNNKYVPLVVVGVIALLVGLFAGYYFEKTKLTAMMAQQAQSYQTQLDQAKKASAQSAAMQPAAAASPIAMGANHNVGNYVTAANGMTLYTYAKDTTDKSNCTGACLTKWPPYLVSGSVPSSLPAHLGVFTTVSGSKQYTWNGMPLYFYAGDKKAGDVNGNGILGVWYVAK